VRMPANVVATSASAAAARQVSAAHGRVVPDSSEDEEENAVEAASPPPGGAKVGGGATDTPQSAPQSAPAAAVQPSRASTELALEEAPSLNLPSGVAGAVGQFLADVNRPVNAASVALKFKDKYTKAQIDKAIQQLVDKRTVLTIEEGAKLYWFNQDLMPSEDAAGAKKSEALFEALQAQLDALSRDRDSVRAAVAELMAQPADGDVAKTLKLESDAAAKLEDRVRACDALADAAAKEGKTAAELQSLTVNDIKLRLAFFRAAWKERKARVAEFLANVADAKGLKNAAKRELLEKIGVETDEDAGAVFNRVAEGAAAGR
jgi:hypothetical protein